MNPRKNFIHSCEPKCEAHLNEASSDALLLCSLAASTQSFVNFTAWAVASLAYGANRMQPMEGGVGEISVPPDFVGLRERVAEAVCDCCLTPEAARLFMHQLYRGAGR